MAPEMACGNTVSHRKRAPAIQSFGEDSRCQPWCLAATRGEPEEDSAPETPGRRWQASPHLLNKVFTINAIAGYILTPIWRVCRGLSCQALPGSCTGKA